VNEFIPQKLPLKVELETKEILKKVISANRALATLAVRMSYVYVR